MSKKFNQLFALVYDFLTFVKLKFYTHSKNEKALLVNLENPQLYHRFTYLMLKFYQLSGYNIYYPMDFSKFRNLRNKDRYLGLIMREKNFLAINNKNLPEKFVELKDEMFSPDYFYSYFEKGNQEENAFHIPMSFHPLMYHNGIWNIKVNFQKTRINSIFCYGNFDSKAYLAIRKTNFKVKNRLDLLHFFQKKNQYLSIGSKEEITENKKGNLNEKYIFAIKENYQIKMEDIRVMQSYFNFYLCCPGVVMPLCHNVIEAMSVGTIPLIEREYAEVMYPNLQNNVNAIIFNNLEHLNEILEQIFNYKEEKISEMRGKILSYYQDFLSPESVVKSINKNIENQNLIYLQAEHRSVKFTK